MPNVDRLPGVIALSAIVRLIYPARTRNSMILMKFRSAALTSLQRSSGDSHRLSAHRHLPVGPSCAFSLSFPFCFPSSRLTLEMWRTIGNTQHTQKCILQLLSNNSPQQIQPIHLLHSIRVVSRSDRKEILGRSVEREERR